MAHVNSNSSIIIQNLTSQQFLCFAFKLPNLLCLFLFMSSVSDMCPKPNYSTNRLSTDSQVADLPEAIPNLFQVLTAERDPHERWLTFTFPVDFDISMFKPQLEKEFKYRTRKVNMRTVFVLELVVLTFFCKSTVQFH